MSLERCGICSHFDHKGASPPCDQLAERVTHGDKTIDYMGEPYVIRVRTDDNDNAPGDSCWFNPSRWELTTYTSEENRWGSMS